jgi:catechol 2,3-dioxygenase
MPDYSIHPDTTVGPVHLTVSDLKNSEAFYREVLGFKPLPRTGEPLALSADGRTTLLELRESKQAPARPRRSTGLYHFAVLMPSRLDLARSMRRLAEAQYPIQGGTDHLVSEALYLADPDDNGIELYRDRPRDSWTLPNGDIRMDSQPLDYDGIFAELKEDGRPWDGLAAGTRIGHVHLNVADLDATEKFYHGVLGFNITVRRSHGALFVSAGGYHHHLGLNIWNGAGAPPPGRDALGLRYYDIQLPDMAELEKTAGRLQAAGLPFEEMDEGYLVRDPSDNGVLLTRQAES